MCLLSAAAASIAALAVPRLRLLPPASSAAEEKRLGAQLQMASDALLRLHDTVLAPAAMEDTDPDAAEIFDRATEAVCNGLPWLADLLGAGERRYVSRPVLRRWPMLAQYRRRPRIFRRRSAPAASSWMHFCRRSTANWTGSYTGGSTGPGAGEPPDASGSILIAGPLFAGRSRCRGCAAWKGKRSTRRRSLPGQLASGGRPSPATGAPASMDRGRRSSSCCATAWAQGAGRRRRAAAPWRH